MGQSISGQDHPTHNRTRKLNVGSNPTWPTILKGEKMEWKALLLVLSGLLLVAYVMVHTQRNIDTCEERGGHPVRDIQGNVHCFESIVELK